MRMLTVVHEPVGWSTPGIPCENCCLCGTSTRYWYEPNDVALCRSCAKTASRADIPTKAEWCAGEDAKFAGRASLSSSKDTPS